MNNLPTYDVIIVGGGPAGSTCAFFLVKSGLHTLLLDRAEFPRVKLCAGWISAPIWNVLELSPAAYSCELWEWHNVHIHFRDRKYTVKSSGYFVRRYEFDEFLLKRSNAQVIQGHNVREIEKDQEGYWVIDRQFRAKYLVGAGGTHCPVARSIFPELDSAQCGTQEREFEGNSTEIAACRAGADGEPEILLHDDMRGYSWNVPKGKWLNIGTGTKVAREVIPAWNKARTFFEGNGIANGTIPLSSRPMLDKMKGHGYRIFESDHLRYCKADNVFVVGDALGLAQPMTGEGILPAVLSGKLCATSIINGEPDSYREQLSTHPIIYDYRVLHSIQTWARKTFKRKESKRYSTFRLRDRIIVHVFSVLFSGKRLPGISTRLFRLLVSPILK